MFRFSHAPDQNRHFRLSIYPPTKFPCRLVCPESFRVPASCLARVSLAPGEKRTATLGIPYDRLALFGRRMKRVVEPGDFEVTVSDQRGTFTVKTGP